MNNTINEEMFIFLPAHERCCEATNFLSASCAYKKIPRILSDSRDDKSTFTAVPPILL